MQLERKMLRPQTRHRIPGASAAELAEGGMRALPKSCG
jgi:hypothetical protein